MEPQAVQYVKALQEARAHELDRRNLRRRRRDQFLVALQSDLDAASRRSLHDHVQLPVTTRSEMEKHLVQLVQRTAGWWGALCDQSIEQRLRYEKSVEDMKKHRRDYLENVAERERNEYAKVCSSENARWESLQEEFREYESTMRQEMVERVRQSVARATVECVDLMNYYCIENAKDNWLVQFAFKRITNKAEFSREPSTYHKDAFNTIFGGRNAYGITGISFKELLDFSYNFCDSDKRGTYEFDACQVPIIMLEGPKLSGKSLLADALEKRFSLCRFNDRSLIEKALKAKPEEQTSGVLQGSKNGSNAMGEKEGDDENGKTSTYRVLDAEDGIAGGTDFSKLGSCDDTLTETPNHQQKIEGAAGSNNSILTASTASPNEPQGSPAGGGTDGSRGSPAEGSAEREGGSGVELGSMPNSALHESEKSLSQASYNAQWVELGNLIRDKLYRGEAIDQSITAELFRLQLREVHPENAKGVIFEGVLNRVVEIPNLLETLVPKRTNRYEEMHRLWCEGLEEAVRERARIRAEEEALAAAAMAAAEADAAAAEAAAQEALEASTKHNSRSSPRKKHQRSASRASIQTQNSIHEPPPSNPPEGVPEILAVARVKLDEPAKKEVRSKGPKRGVDLSQLPPPELPAVEDIADKVRAEEDFIARALGELEGYTGLLSCILYVDTTQQEIFRRFAGLRIDRDTSEQYHLVYNPPPKERMPYLISCDRTTSFSSELYDVVFRQKQEWEELRKWFMRDQTLRNRVHELEGDKKMDLIEADAQELVHKAMEMFTVGKKLYDAMLDARERIEMLKRTRAEQVAAREAERVRLAELYTEKGVPLPAELEVAGEIGAWCPVPEEVPPMVLRTVQDFHNMYARTYHGGWEEFSSLSCMILEYRRSARAQLKRFWRQPDDKQATLDQFVRQFNSVPKRFRCKPPCKEELHLLTDELSTNLFSSVETKKKDGMTLIDHVTRRDAYLDGWEANVCNIGALMVQQEVERFTLIVNLTVLYFAAAHEEPVMFEEVDTDVNLIRALEATGDLAGAAKNKSDKRSVSARKGHGRPNEESGDSSILEAFTETVQRLVNGVTSLTEKFKLKVQADASGKGQKKVTLRSLKLSAITSSCTPFLETEQAAALERIGCVKRFVTELARQGENYIQSIKTEMMTEAREMLMRQAAAVNSAVFAVRCAIEEEDEVSAMHIGCGTFSILDPKVRDRVAVTNAVRNPCFLTDVPLYATGADLTTPVHDTLNGSRLMELIQLFRCAAPKYQLCQDSFMTIVSDDDYAGAAKEGEYLLGTNEVFRLFDPMSTGVMDWRELIVHLLFWCCPPGKKGEKSRYIPEMTIAELQEMRRHLGDAPVTEDQFRECPFFFDQHLKADRRDVYVRALWYTFENPSTHTVDPFDVLCFLCIDVQPIRGMQKAFALFSDENQRLLMPVLERILHVRATNARALALWDPFSKPNLYILLANRKIISFKDACNCAMGRHIFNRCDFMMRKKFVCLVA